MHSHESGGGVQLPPTRHTETQMHSHKPSGRLSARPTVTFLSLPKCPMPIGQYQFIQLGTTKRHISIENLPKVFTPRYEPTTS